MKRSRATLLNLCAVLGLGTLNPTLFADENQTIQLTLDAHTQYEECHRSPTGEAREGSEASVVCTPKNSAGISETFELTLKKGGCVVYEEGQTECESGYNYKATQSFAFGKPSEEFAAEVTIIKYGNQPNPYVFFLTLKQKGKELYSTYSSWANLEDFTILSTYNDGNNSRSYYVRLRQ